MSLALALRKRAMQALEKCERLQSADERAHLTSIALRLEALAALEHARETADRTH